MQHLEIHRVYYINFQLHQVEMQPIRIVYLLKKGYNRLHCFINMYSSGTNSKSTFVDLENGTIGNLEGTGSKFKV